MKRRCGNWRSERTRASRRTAVSGRGSVIEIHAMQLAVHGGATGLRDRGLLESAVAQPQAAFGGALVHDGLFTMAAAYLFHIVRNHPFVDGNKRTGTLAALVFLDLVAITS